jgi:aspartyl aminopeptidase
MTDDTTLARDRSAVWNSLSERELLDIEELVTAYKYYLDNAKTEREAVTLAEAMAKGKGFVPLEDVERSVAAGSSEPLTGKKVYITNKGKNILLAVIGTDPIVDGCAIVASHVDSPRLDLKPNPLIQKEHLAVLKTHYYGGFKKFHFANVPLALHGVIFKKNGERLTIALGEDPDDPVFTVTDILIHLAKKVQYERKTPEVIKGEEMNILFSSIHDMSVEESKRAKQFALKLLYEKYGIVEEDLISAEIEAVPAGKARDVGLDRSMVGAYGHDDRICAFTSIKALFEVDMPKRTSIVFLADKEEVDSDGNTGMNSDFFQWALARLLALQGETSTLSLMNACMRSEALSADVGAAVNPNFPDVHDKHNAARLGHGVFMTKYTGKSGKYNANDTNAEFISKVRTIFNDAGVKWQIGELGKVDEGGGGTIAKYLSRLGMDIIDCGPALLAMHSTFEVASKADVWTAKRAYRAFFEYEGA